VKNRAKIAAINLCNAMHKQGKKQLHKHEGRKEGRKPQQGGQSRGTSPQLPEKGKI